MNVNNNNQSTVEQSTVGQLFCDKKTEDITEKILTKEEVELTLQQLKDYYTYINLIDYSKEHDIKIEKVNTIDYCKGLGIEIENYSLEDLNILKNEFDRLKIEFENKDQENFFNDVIKTLSNVFEEKNQHIYDSIKNYKNFFYLYSNSSKFFSAFKSQQDLNKLAEIFLLINLCCSGITNIFNDRIFDLIPYVDKMVFRDEYFHLALNSTYDAKLECKPGLISYFRARIYMCAEKYQEVIREGDAVLFSKDEAISKIGVHYCSDFYFMCGKAKRALNFIDSGNRDLNVVIDFCKKNIGDKLNLLYISPIDVKYIATNKLIIAKTYFVLEQFDKSLEICESIRKEYYQTPFLDEDQTADLYLLMAQIDFETDKFSEAFDKILTVLSLKPGFQECLILKNRIENHHRFIFNTKPFNNIHFIYV